MIISITIGFSLAALNTLSGYLISRWAMKKEDNKFRNIVFISLVIRYFVTSVIVFLILITQSVNQLGFSLSFLIFTFILIMLEIFYLLNRVNFLNLYDKLNK
jgi:hypothetical protein